MKIAVIGVTEIPSFQGEVERYCQEFYPRIAARGHQVDIFIQPEYQQQRWFSLDYHRNVRVISLVSLPHKQINFLFCSAISTIWASLGNYDVIHIHGAKAGWFAGFAQIFSRAKIILTNHQLDCQPHQYAKIFRWLLPLLEKIAVRNADEIIVSSKALGEYFKQKYQVCPRYLPHAVQVKSDREITGSFKYGQSLGLETKGYLLYLGQLTPENQPDLLLRAFQKLKPLGWKLVLAGGIGDSVKYAVQLLSMAKHEPNIIFTNEIKGQYLTEIIQNAGLLVAPSESWDLGLPSGVLEAMAAGVPVLASDTLVYRELIGEDRGLLFQSGHLNSLIGKLQYAFAEPWALSAMGQKAQNYITINHNWDRVTYGNLALYLKSIPQISPPLVQHQNSEQ